MVEITYQMVLSTIQTASLVVGIIYYLTIMRNQQRNQELTLKAQEQAIESRNTQFLMQLYSDISDEESIKMIFSDKTWDTFDEWWELYGPTKNPDAFAKWLHAMLTYEIIGVLLKRGFLDIEVIDDLMSGGTLMIWDRYGSIIEGLRERFGYPQLQEHQEYMASEIRKIVNKQHPDYEGRKLA